MPTPVQVALPRPQAERSPATPGIFRLPTFRRPGPRSDTPEQPPLVKGAPRQRRGFGCKGLGPKVLLRKTLGLLFEARLRTKVAEPADKPGSVVDSHSSRRTVAGTLEQPTRTRRGPRHEVPIWSCSRWGLPCRPVARLAVRSYRTISPLPRASCETVRRYLSVALSVGSRRPGVTWHRALWSPDFPRHPLHRSGLDDATAWPTPPRALCHARAASPPPGQLPSPPPYRDLREAPVSSAAILAALDGGRCLASTA